MGMASCGVDLDAGLFILGPELPDISATEARRALASSDVETLSSMLHPAVTEWCLHHGPYRTEIRNPPRAAEADANNNASDAGDSAGCACGDVEGAADTSELS